MESALCGLFYGAFRHSRVLYGEGRETNKMQLIRCLLSNFYLNMFRASLCPSSGAVLTTQLHTTTANGSQHNQCRTPYGAVHGLILLTMGIMLPETCWDRSLMINIGLVVSCWFLSLHTTSMLHDHRNLKLRVLYKVECYVNNEF